MRRRIVFQSVLLYLFPASGIKSTWRRAACSLREADSRAHPAILRDQLEPPLQVFRHQRPDDMQPQPAARAMLLDGRVRGSVVPHLDRDRAPFLSRLDDDVAAF